MKAMQTDRLAVTHTNPSRSMKILLVQTSYLGDTILSTPVIRGIRDLYPEANLWMMTTPLSASLVRRDPLLTGVIPFDKRGVNSGVQGLFRMSKTIRRHHFDRCYSLHRSARTALLLSLSRIPIRIGFDNARLNFFYHRTRNRNPARHDVIRNLSLLSGEMPVSGLSTDLRLFPPDKKELSGKLQIQLPAPGSYAILVPGSAWETKRWDWRGYREVARFLRNQGLEVVLIGAPSERSVAEKVARGLDVLNFAGMTTVDDALYLTRHAKLMVCNDSMALHMASAFKVPTAAVFCATTPEFGFGPWKNPKATVVEKTGLSCKPCGRHGGKFCPAGTDSCMRDLSAGQVISAIRRMLDI